METKFKLGQRVKLSAKHNHPHAEAGHEGTVVSDMGVWYNVVLDTLADSTYSARDLNYFNVDEDETSPLAVAGTPCYYASQNEFDAVENTTEPETTYERFTYNGVTVPAELVAVLTFIQRNNLKVSEVIYDYTVTTARATGQVNFTITEA